MTSLTRGLWLKLLNNLKVYNHPFVELKDKNKEMEIDCGLLWTKSQSLWMCYDNWRRHRNYSFGLKWKIKGVGGVKPFFFVFLICLRYYSWGITAGLNLTLYVIVLITNKSDKLPKRSQLKLPIFFFYFVNLYFTLCLFGSVFHPLNGMSRRAH